MEMYKATSIKRFFIDSNFRFNFFAKYGLLNWMYDEEYIRRMFKANMGYQLNLDNPQTFNEKLQWLKLYDRKPIYTTMVDKYAVKDYVASIIGEQYIIPTLGVWDRVEDIDFESLPEQFVLKCTHDSQGLVICRDKTKLNSKAAKKKLRKRLNQNYYLRFREWPYKDVKPRIIAEQYMEDTLTAELRDYKFFCFDGEPKIMLVASGRMINKEVCIDFYDMNFIHLPFQMRHPNAKIVLEKPENFEKMKELARELSKSIPHIRVDFYEVDSMVYFGEMTLFDSGGFAPFKPAIWDRILGDYIQLSSR